MGIEWPELTKLSRTYFPPKNALPPPPEMNVSSPTQEGEHLSDENFYKQFAPKESKPIDYLKAIYEEKINTNLSIVNSFVESIKKTALQAAMDKRSDVYFRMDYPIGTINSTEEAVHLNNQIFRELRRQGFSVAPSSYCIYSRWWRNYYYVGGTLSGWA